MANIAPTHSQTQVCYFNILCSSFNKGKKKYSNQISTLSASIFPFHRILKGTHSDCGSDMHPGWRLIPVADESRHDGIEAYNVIYGAGLTFQIQSGTLITDENLRQEIALIANENLMRHKSTDVCKCARANTGPIWTWPNFIRGDAHNADIIDKAGNPENLVTNW